MAVPSWLSGVHPTAVIPLLFFVVAAGWSIHAFTDDSTDALWEAETRQYDATVAAWGSYARKMFAALDHVGFSVTTSPLVGRVEDMVLEAKDAEDRLPIDWDASANGVHTYDPLYYHGSVGVDLGYEWADLASQTLSLDVGGQTLTIPNVTLGRRIVHRTSNWKQCQFSLKGTLDRGKSLCYVYKVARELCVTVKGDNRTNAPAVTWALAGGCGGALATGDNKMVGVRFATLDVPRYVNSGSGASAGADADATDGGLLPSTSTTHSNTRVRFTMAVRVRSVDDPLLKLEEVTQGTLRLDQSPTARLRLAWVMLALAIFFLLLFGFIIYYPRRYGVPAEGSKTVKYSSVNSQRSGKGSSEEKRTRRKSPVAARESAVATDQVEIEMDPPELRGSDV